MTVSPIKPTLRKLIRTVPFPWVKQKLTVSYACLR